MLRFPANDIDDQLDWFGARNKICGLKVDHLVSAQFPHESDDARSAGSNHLHAYTMSKLNDETADSSSGAVDRNTLTAVQTAVVENRFWAFR